MRLLDLLRAVLFSLALLLFLGWGFSGETGLPGNAMLLAVLSTLCVSLTPDGALIERSGRIFFVTVDLMGVAAIAIWTGDQYMGSRLSPGWQPAFIGAVTALGLLAGLARLQRSSAAVD